MKKRIIPFVAAMFAISIGSALQANVTVQLGADAPEENIAISFVPGEGAAVGNATSYYRGLPTSPAGEVSRSYGQSFNVSGGVDLSMQAITWKVYGANAAVFSKEFSISIYEMSSVSSSTDMTLLSRQTGVLPESISVGNYITFNLDNPIELAASKAYMVLFSFDEATSTTTSASGSLGFERNNANANFGRTWFATAYENGTVTYSADNKASTFYLRAVPAVPEAKVTALLLGLAVASAVLVVKRRRRA